MTAEHRIYLDHAATTPVHPQVLEAMLPYFSETFGNPSSLYRRGREALLAVERAREAIAQIIGAEPSEIVFTSGGSESDNLAIRGCAFAGRRDGARGHLVTSAVEHHAVLHTCRQLADQFGFDLTLVPVDSRGVVDPADVERVLREDTLLISVMLANNEVGTVQPIAKIGALARSRGIPFHSDAVQAGGAIPLNVHALAVDLLSLSAHKFYGPKGVGVLYIRKGLRPLPVQTGGAQERSRRAGTEYTAGIVGMAKALEMAQASLPESNLHLKAMRDRLVTGIPALIEGAHPTGDPSNRLPGHATFVIDGVEGEALILGLDQLGIEASTGSACTSGSTEPSHVLRAMGIPDELARGSLRLTLGHENTDEDVECVSAALPPLVDRLRRQND